MKKLGLISLMGLLFCYNLLLADTINVPTSYSTIQAAIDTAVNGDTVLVQSGTYVENINFSGKNITVASLFLTTQDTSYITQTIIDGNDLDAVVRIKNGEDSTALLTGFTIKNGKYSAYEPGLGYCGGGIYCLNSNPRLEYLIVTNNNGESGNGHGAGIYCREANPTIVNSKITNNEGNGIYCRQSSPTITHSIISGNTWNGGIYCHKYSSPSIGNVIIENNSGMSGGGLTCDEYSNPILKYVTISGNNSWMDGGGIYCQQHSNPVLENCIIRDNESEESGGGITCWNGSLTLENVIIANNTAKGMMGMGGGAGGGIVMGALETTSNLRNVLLVNNVASNNFGHGIEVDGGFASCAPLILTNCILWNDSINEISVGSLNNYNNASVTISYSDIQGGTNGVSTTFGTLNWLGGNINSYPMFVDTANANYSFFSQSPCIDAGLDSIVTTLTDVYGHIRKWDGNNDGTSVVDMGPIEYGSPSSNCADIKLDSIQVGNTAYVGDSIQISFEIESIGSCEFYMNNCVNAVYISTDTVWDIHDILLTTDTAFYQIPTQQCVYDSITAYLPALTESSHYIIVRANVFGDIHEQNSLNNILASDFVQVLYNNELFVNTLCSDTLLDNTNLYYKLSIHDTLIGNSMILNLTSALPSSENEIYISHDKNVNENSYDYYSTVSDSGIQEIVIPYLDSGNYYINIYGDNNLGTNQPITLFADIPDFGISSINPAQGGNTGFVTFKVNGVQFDTTLSAFLINNLDTIFSDTIYYKDPATIFPSFDLTCKNIGFYDVILKKANGAITTLSNGFEIVSGVPPNLSTQVSHPSFTRPGWIETIVITYKNEGNTDIFLPSATLLSKSGAPIGFSIEQLQYGLNSLYLPLIEDNSLKNILIPGASGILFYHAKSTGQNLDFELIPSLIINYLTSFACNVVWTGGDCSCVPDLIFTNACSNHDQCYEACVPNFIDNKKARANCDLYFFNDLIASCLTNNIGSALFGLCISTTVSYYAGVRWKGQDFWDNAQVNCDPSPNPILFPFPNIIVPYPCRIISNCYEILNLNSFDPNDIIGSSGYGEQNWISIEKILSYKIRFENHPDSATASAQQVVVSFDIDPNMDVSSIQLGSFGFGDFVFPIPPESDSYSERLDVVDSLGVYVDVEASINSTEGTVNWTFQTIDPNTGFPTTDPFAGFLPVNDSITHKGEGFVNLLVKPKNSCVTGDTILASAEIVFDSNIPISTNVWKNTVDALPPVTIMDSLPTISYSDTLLLNWQSQDDTGGVGVSHYDLLVSENTGAFYYYETSLDTNYFEFVGGYDTTYSFVVIATDHVGNKEVADFNNPVSTQLINPFLNIIEPQQYSGYCPKDSLFISWNSVGIEQHILDVSVNGGYSYSNIDTITIDTSYYWAIPINFSNNDSCIIRISDTSNTHIAHSSYFGVHSIDTILTQAFTCIPSQAGIDTMVYSNQNGCDSVEILTTTLSPSDSVSLQYAICQNESINFNGQLLNQSGIYYDTLINQYGCDSIIDLTLLVNPIYHTPITESICQGDSLLLGGVYQTSAGIYYDSLLTINNCDSIIETNLTVNPVYLTPNTASICQGDSILLGGIYQTTAGIYYDTLQTVNSCDSIIETNLIVNPVYLTPNTASICQGDSIMLGGIYQTTAGIYYDTLQTVNSCDSIIETNLIVNPIYTTPNTASICQGDSILLGGIYQTTAGIYYDVLQTVNSCDSIIETTLTVNPVYTTPNTASICQGDSILLGGIYQTTAGIYYDTLQTVNSCDSIIETNLTVNPLPFVQLGNDTTIAYSESILLDAGNGFINYDWSTGETTQIINVDSTNITTDSIAVIWVAVTDVNACAGSDTIMIAFTTTVGLSELKLDEIVNIFPNPTDGRLDIKSTIRISEIRLYTSTGILLINKKANSYEIVLELGEYPSGIYHIWIITENGNIMKKIIRL